MAKLGLIVFVALIAAIVIASVESRGIRPRPPKPKPAPKPKPVSKPDPPAPAKPPKKPKDDFPDIPDIPDIPVDPREIWDADSDVAISSKCEDGSCDEDEDSENSEDVESDSYVSKPKPKPKPTPKPKPAKITTTKPSCAVHGEPCDTNGPFCCRAEYNGKQSYCDEESKTCYMDLSWQ